MRRLGVVLVFLIALPVSWLATAATSSPDEGAPQLFEVLYMSDVDRLAVTRYRVDPETGQPGAFEFRGYFGPARGLGILMYGGVGGTVMWLALVRWYRARRRSRREGPSRSASRFRPPHRSTQ